jgi:hypothetical protein
MCVREVCVRKEVCSVVYFLCSGSPGSVQCVVCNSNILTYCYSHTLVREVVCGVQFATAEQRAESGQDAFHQSVVLKKIVLVL